MPGTVRAHSSARAASAGSGGLSAMNSSSRSRYARAPA
jgi:hypothetical protein